MPWPYSMRDAEAFLASPRDPVLPSLLIFERGTGAPQLVGGCGLGRRPSGSVEIGYWIARPFWGRGYATEACTALVDMARALGLLSLEGSHFVDNPAFGASAREARLPAARDRRSAHVLRAREPRFRQG